MSREQYVQEQAIQWAAGLLTPLERPECPIGSMLKAKLGPETATKMAALLGAGLRSRPCHQRFPHWGSACIQ
jgi:hypothetical protein